MKSKHKEMITGISALVVISLFVLIFCFPINFLYTGHPYKSQALSSIKQIGTSTMIYLSDYDERYPATSAMPGTRAVLMQYIKNSQLFESRKAKFDRPQFNFTVAGVLSVLPPYPGTKQLELTDAAVWSNLIIGETPGMIVGRADTSAKFYGSDNLTEAFALFNGQFDRKGVKLFPPDYLADKDPLK